MAFPLADCQACNPATSAYETLTKSRDNRMKASEIDSTVIELVNALAKLVETRSVATDKDAARIRDMRIKLLHDLALASPS